MTTYSIRPFLLGIFILLGLTLFGQKEIKFGKVDPADLAMTELAADTSAGAYVLHHGSKVFFSFSGTPMMFQSVKRRVKLLKRSGFDEADVELRYYPQYQKITDLKAMIHLPDGNTIKLKGRDFVREDLDDDWRSIKFTFPQVTEGAIIEYGYRKSNENFTWLPRFYFQENVPVRWAEYRASIPEYYRYVSLSNAHNVWAEHSSTVDNEQVSGIAMRVQNMNFALADLPAFKDQPYTNNLTDYLPKIYMQLQTVAYPGQEVQNVFTTWQELAKDLDNFAWFGKKYNNRSDVAKPLNDMAPLLEKATTETEKARVAYGYIGQHMNWDGEHRITSDNRLNQCWSSKTGNSAELNMLLLGVLLQLDIQAEPLLVSLRNQGAPITTFPVYDQFDHLMVLARLDGKQYILDVNDTSRPMGMPRFKALNGAGWVASPENPRWIPIKSPRVTSTITAEISLDDTEDGMATVDIQSRKSSYYALNSRNALSRMEDDKEGPLMSDIIDIFPDAEFISRELEEEDDIRAPHKIGLKARVPLAQIADDYIYLSPIISYPLEEGLVDTETRYAPVDLGYPSRHRYVAKIKIPEGYAVEEMPESIRMRSEDGSVSASFTAAKDEETISVNYTLDLGRAVFTADEYYALKEIFERAIELQTSMLVLRRVK